jgi:hypothetical protein
MRLIAPQHLDQSTGVIGEAPDPAVVLQLVEVVGDLPGRSTADRASNPAHRNLDECARRVGAKVAADQLDLWDGSGPHVACDTWCHGFVVRCHHSTSF